MQRPSQDSESPSASRHLIFLISHILEIRHRASGTLWRVVPVGLLLNPPPGPPPHLVPPTSEQARPLMTSGLFLTVFQTTFQTPLWPPTWPSERPLDTKMVSQASVWEPLWRQIGDSGPLAKPYYLLCFHYKRTLRKRTCSDQNSNMHPWCL